MSLELGVDPNALPVRSLECRRTRDPILQLDPDQTGQVCSGPDWTRRIRAHGQRRQHVQDSFDGTDRWIRCGAAVRGMPLGQLPAGRDPLFRVRARVPGREATSVYARRSRQPGEKSVEVRPVLIQVPGLMRRD